MYFHFALSLAREISKRSSGDNAAKGGTFFDLLKMNSFQREEIRLVINTESMKRNEFYMYLWLSKNYER